MNQKITDRDIELLRRRAIEEEENESIDPVITRTPLKQIVAEPVEPEMMPETEISEPAIPESAMNTPLPVQPEPVQPIEPLSRPVLEEDAQQTVTPEPGSTALSRERAAPEEDEYEQLFSKYKEDTTKAREEATGAEAEFQRASAQSAMETGIAGALQSFGEGLAAITGGSAKGLQTGAETLRSVGQQRLMSADRKTRSLKDRLQAAREPLEAKKEELGFRGVFEKRQKEKRLADPASKESADARDMATNFLDVVAENYRSKGAEDLAARVEQNKAFLENANANQIKEFVDKISGLKVSTDYETSLEGKRLIEREKQEGKKELGETKRDQKLMDVADKRFMDDSDKMAVSVKAMKDFSNELKKFQADVKLLQNLNADSKQRDAALGRVKTKRGLINYLIARAAESKGVFTNQDFEILSQFEAGRSWGEVIQDYVSKGVGEVTTDSLERMSSVLDDVMPRYQNPEKDIIEQRKRIYKASDNPYIQKAADKFNTDLFGLKQDSKTPSSDAPVEQKAKPESKQGVMEFTSQQDVQKAIDSGRLKPGDSGVITNSDGSTKPFRVE
jgi:hypothetical protein